MRVRRFYYLWTACMAVSPSPVFALSWLAVCHSLISAGQISEGSSSSCLSYFSKCQNIISPHMQKCEFITRSHVSLCSVVADAREKWLITTPFKLFSTQADVCAQNINRCARKLAHCHCASVIIKLQQSIYHIKLFLQSVSALYFKVSARLPALQFSARLLKLSYFAINVIRIRWEQLSESLEQKAECLVNGAVETFSWSQSGSPGCIWWKSLLTQQAYRCSSEVT